MRHKRLGVANARRRAALSDMNVLFQKFERCRTDEDLGLQVATGMDGLGPRGVSPRGRGAPGSGGGRGGGGNSQASTPPALVGLIPGGLAYRLQCACELACTAGVEAAHTEPTHARLSQRLSEPSLRLATEDVAVALRELERSCDPTLLRVRLPKAAQCIAEAKWRVDLSALPERYKRLKGWPALDEAEKQLAAGSRAVARREAAARILESATSGAKAASGVAANAKAGRGGRYDVQASLVHLQSLLPRAIEGLQAAVDEATDAFVERRLIEEALLMLEYVQRASSAAGAGDHSQTEQDGGGGGAGGRLGPFEV